MRQNIYIKEPISRRRSKKTYSPFKLSLLLLLFLLPIALLILEGSDFTSALKYVFGKKNIVIYNTFSVNFDDSIPESFVQKISDNLGGMELNGKKRFEVKDSKADINLTMEKDDNSKEILMNELIPVGHIYSLVKGIQLQRMSEYSVYILDSNYKEFLQDQYNFESTVLDSYEALVNKLSENDQNIGLISFTDLDHQVKVLTLDEVSYLKDSNGSIQIKMYASVKSKVDDFILSVLEKNMNGTGEVFDRELLAKVNMSGVVAIARALAGRIDRSGDNAYPARSLGGFLSDADLTHISNEVSFVPGCTAYSGMSFCAKPQYIDVLTASGVDIVELTGNHNNDYGSQYNASTIEKYKELGMRYFGGGLNTEDASKILYEEVNGNRIAFVGYNYYDTVYRSLALAGDSRAGANLYSSEKLESDIETARENADIVIITFQFQECYSYPDGDVIYPICYKPLSVPDQRGVFKEAIDFGADIVVGTQAHQPQTYELYKDGVIFYGLGNLYFDQSMWIGTRQGIILSHYFYNGKHLQTEITPTYMEGDLIPRLATEKEGDLLLELLKEARD